MAGEVYYAVGEHSEDDCCYLWDGFFAALTAARSSYFHRGDAAARIHGENIRMDYFQPICPHPFKMNLS